ncbi:unnamed protein product [Peronospora farinosa]|uniref:RRM domain-containing protein n=1 Tax=Peronospora farinosa TaxID=134698 RepID=A0ABN8BZ86_9STRA|nr:unnamed protein product [Peronospora farinosa]
MDNEDKDFLREWLILNLEPVSDADPEVLSKYVLALVQNDPHTLDLQETCVSKLEEFLGEETKGFVVKLFKALADGSYKASRVVNEAPRDEQFRAVNIFEENTSRRRDRTLLNEEDEQQRYTKRCRGDDRPRDNDVKRHQGSPRRDFLNFNRRQPYPSRDGGMRGGPVGPVGPVGGRGPYGMGGERPRTFPLEWGMPPQGMWPPHFPPHRGAGFPPEFDINGYMRESGGMMPPPHMMMPHPMVGGRGQFFPPGGRGGRGRRDNFFAERGGKDGENGEATTAKTTLYVRHVDPKYVNMTMLSLHFSKFGNVVNVQMRPNAKCAFVQYATEDEAKKAFHSPLPVCNNRFISVKWARHDARSPEEAAVDQSGAGSKEAFGENCASNNDLTAEKNAKEAGGDGKSSDAMPENNMTTEELRAAALEKGRLVLEQKRELLEKQRTLKKQKEALIKRQLAQQKELLERMSANSSQFSIAEKRGLLDKITALSAELKTLTPSHSAVSPSAARSVETGEDSENLNGLKAELSALEAEAEASGDRGGRGGRWSSGRGYRGGRGGRGRGGYGRGSHTLDNRTTIVKVANLPEEARDPIVLTQHFGNFGAVERVVMDEAAPGQGFIKFQDRFAAQSALHHGNVFSDKQLEIGWVEYQDAPAELTRSDLPTEAAAASAVADPTPTGTSDQVQLVEAA